MSRFIFCVSIAFCVFAALFIKPVAGDVHKCINQEGKVSYSDKPCNNDDTTMVYIDRAEGQYGEGNDAAERVARALAIQQGGFVQKQKIVTKSNEKASNDLSAEEPVSAPNIPNGLKSEEDAYSTRTRMSDKCRRGNDEICKALSALASPRLNKDSHLKSLASDLSSECVSGKLASCNRIVALSQSSKRSEN